MSEIKTPNLLLRAESLSVGYDGAGVLREFDLSLLRGEALLLSGPNGSGKTTLLRTILGLLPPLSGKILFYNADGQICPRLSIGYLPQMSHLDKQFPIRVKEVIMSGLQGLHLKRDLREICVRTLSQTLEIEALLSRPIVQLSGGELQRVLLARALASNPDLLVLDEPNTYLDAASKAIFYRSLECCRGSECSLLLVSHDPPPSGKITWRIQSTIREGC